MLYRGFIQKKEQYFMPPPPPRYRYICKLYLQYRYYTISVFPMHAYTCIEQFYTTHNGWNEGFNVFQTSLSPKSMYNVSINVMGTDCKLTSNTPSGQSSCWISQSGCICRNGLNILSVVINCLESYILWTNNHDRKWIYIQFK